MRCDDPAVAVWEQEVWVSEDARRLAVDLVIEHELALVDQCVCGVDRIAGLLRGVAVVVTVDVDDRGVVRA